MMALSSVLQREIRSVYPAMNGVLDKCVGILNTTLCPRIANKKRSFESIYLMWTRAEGKLESGNEFRTWVPNHFVPLVEQGAGRSTEVKRSLMVRWVNKGRGMCYPVCGMVHIKEPLLLIGKSSLCGGSGFPLSLSEWSLTICLTPYNRR